MTGDGFGGVVLSGGTGVRLGGADKASLELDGTTLLDRALRAVAAADEVVVVGPPRPTRAGTSRAVSFVVEDPPAGGPAAGLLAGLEALTLEHGEVVVLAVDMPYVDAATIRRLRAALGQHDAAFLVDATGRRQLAGVLRPDRLARPVDRHGLPMHRLLAGLSVAALPALGREAADVDTWSDVKEIGGLRVPGSP